MEKPLISVIVPVYKAEKYLNKCVDSIIAQTYENIEIILVDDGSPDGSGDICNEYALADNRVLAVHKENGGVSDARNVGIERSKGEYLMFVDSDDFISPDMVEALYSVMCKYCAEIALCGSYTVRGDDKELEENKYAEICVENQEKAEYFNEHYGTSLINAPWGALYKRTLVGKFKKGMSLGEDTLFKLQCIRKASRVAVTSGAFYFYKCFDNENSLSNVFVTDHFDNYMVLYRETVDFLSSEGNITVGGAHKVNYTLIEYLTYFMNCYALSNDKTASLAYIRRICSDKDVHRGAKKSIGKGGLKHTLRAILIYLKLASMIYSKAKMKERD